MWRIFSHSRGTPKPIRRPLRSAFRPRLEALEDRWLPNTYSWFQSVDGAFNDSSRWRDQNNNPGVPGPGDIANIATSGETVTIPTGASVLQLNSGVHMVLSGGTLAVANNSSVNQLDMSPGTSLNIPNNVVFNIDVSTVNSQLNGAITVGSFATLNLVSFTLNGSIAAAAGATVNMEGSNMQVNAGGTMTGPGTYFIGGSTLNPTLTVNADFAAPPNLVMNTSGGINGVGNLNVSGSLTAQVGTLSGPGAVNVAAGGTMNIPSPINNVGRPINNSGTVSFTNAGHVYDVSGGALNNLVGGSVTVQTDSDFWDGDTNPASAINNSGTFMVTSNSGAGTTTVNCPLNNSGTVSVQSGTLALLRGGIGTGAWNTAAGAALAYNGGPYNLNAGSTFAGSGSVGGSVNVNASLTTPNFTYGRGGLTVAPGVTWTVNSALNVTGETLTDNGAIVLPSGATFDWTGGTIQGSGSVAVQAGGSLAVGGAAIKSLDGSMALTNAGTGTWTAGQWNLGGGTTFANSGTFTIQCDAGWYGDGSGPGVIANSGTLVKTSPTGTGTTYDGIALNNTGTVSAQSGTLQVAGNASLNAGTNSGVLTAVPGGIIAFTGSTYTLNPGSSITGTGTVAVQGATLSVAGAVTASNFELDSGTVSLPSADTLTINGTFTWNGGNISSANGTAIVTVPKGATLNLASTQTVSLQGYLSVGGTVNWTGTGNMNFSNGGTITNLATGVFSLKNDQSMSGSGTFINKGLLIKNGGTATSTIGITLNNSGLVEVLNNTLSVTGPVSQVSGNTLTGGIWSVFGSSTVFSTLSFASSVNLTTIGAPASVTLNGLNTSFTNLAGLNSVAGKFGILGGQTFTTAGDLTATGSLTIGPTSTLAVSGNFMLASTGTLVIQLGGSNAAPSVGKLTTAAGKTVTLAGTLSFTDSAKVTPAIGKSFTILNNLGSSAISGIFAGLPEGSTIMVNGMTFQISYVGGTGNDVTLTRIA
jgi:hypothetical protein